MNRAKLNFIIDFIAFVAFLLLTTTGVLMRYVLPPGSGHGSIIWSLDRHAWGGIHFWVSIIFFAILALHLVLHWRWIVSVVTGKQREGSGLRVGLGFVGLLSVVALSVAPLLSPIETGAGGSVSVLSSHKYEDIVIRGSMTLKDVEEVTGAPAAYLIESLKLPEFTSVNQPLGLLRREYGFAMNDVREVVKTYKAKK